MAEKRQRVYAAAMALFMILALFLTFFSKTVYRGNLPLVTVVFPMRGEFVNITEGQTQVDYSLTHNLYAEYSGRIREICVSPGDTVEEGDVLMAVELTAEPAMERTAGSAMEPTAEPAVEPTAEPVTDSPAKPAVEPTVEDAAEPVVSPVEGGGSEEKGGYIRIRSPWSGTVLEVGVEEGMYVGAQQNVVLAVVADISGCWEAEFWTDGDACMEENSTVTVEIKGVDEEIQGRITSAVPSAGEDGRPGYLITAAFEYGGADIAGKTADVTIRSQGRYYDEILPAEALQRDAVGYYVLTLQEENGILGNNYVVHRVSVDLLDEDGTAVALMGVTEGMSVILPGEQEISPGDRVRYQ